MESSEFSDVFVSYRRKDVEFTKKIVESLREAGKEVWIDWEDIPPGSIGFADDIKRGLEGADAFIAILSPDYLESTYCVDMELGYAIELNKRIIPIVLKKFDDYEIPNGIGHINWIYFTPHAGHENTYEESFQKIIDTLNTDLDYRRVHKRLALRALEWDELERKNSYLLQGDEISTAESWMGNGVAKDPLPTKLHGEYIMVSRKLYSRRQKQLLSAVTIGLIVTIVLSIGILALYNQAEILRKLADRRADEAYSLALATGSQVALGEGLPDEAIALAYSATDIDNPPTTSETILSDVLNQVGTHYRLSDHSEQILQVARHPNQPWMVTTSSDKSIIIWDYEAGEVIKTITDFADWTYTADFNPDGTQLAVGIGNGEVKVFDTETWEEKLSFLAHELGARDLTYTPDGTQIVTTGCWLWNDEANKCEESDITVWNAETGEEILLFELYHEPGIIYSIDVSPDGQQVLSAAEDKQIFIWDIETGNRTLTFAGHEDEVFIADFVADGAQIVSASGDKTVKLWDVETQTIIREYVGHGGRAVSVTVSDDGQWVASGSFDSDIWVWNKATGEQKYALNDHTAGVMSLVFSHDGDSLISGSQDTDLRVWDMKSSMLLDTLHGLNGRILQSVVLSADDATLYAGDRDGNIASWNTDTGEMDYVVDADGEVWALAITPDDEKLLAGHLDGTISLHDASTGDETQRYKIHKDAVRAIQVLPDGDSAISCGDDNIMYLWAIEDGTVIREFAEHSNVILDCVISPDASHILTASADFTVGYWDIETGDLIQQMNNHTDWVWSVDFNADGTQAVSSSRDLSIIVWDLDDGSVLQQLKGGHSSEIGQVRFTPNPDYILSAARDTTLVLWNIKSGLPLRTLEGHSDAIWAMEFDNNETVYTGSSDGTVRQWQLVYGLNDLRQWGEDMRYVRALTDDEALQFALPSSDDNK